MEFQAHFPAVTAREATFSDDGDKIMVLFRDGVPVEILDASVFGVVYAPVETAPEVSAQGTDPADAGDHHQARELTMANVQIGEERRIGSVGVKVFRLDLPENALPLGVREIYSITMIDKYGHASGAVIPREPSEDVIARAVDVHVRLSQAKTRRN